MKTILVSIFLFSFSGSIAFAASNLTSPDLERVQQMIITHLGDSAGQVSLMPVKSSKAKSSVQHLFDVVGRDLQKLPFDSLRLEPIKIGKSLINYFFRNGQPRFCQLLTQSEGGDVGEQCKEFLESVFASLQFVSPDKIGVWTYGEKGKPLALHLLVSSIYGGREGLILRFVF